MAAKRRPRCRQRLSSCSETTARFYGKAPSARAILRKLCSERVALEHPEQKKNSPQRTQRAQRRRREEIPRRFAARDVSLLRVEGAISEAGRRRLYRGWLGPARRWRWEGSTDVDGKSRRPAERRRAPL